MDIVSTANAPRIVSLGKQVYWVRSLDFEGFAIVLGWLDDVLPGRAERKMPPNWHDDASQNAMQSLPGKNLLIWLALRHQGVNFEHAGTILDIMTGLPDSEGDFEYLRLLDVLLSHRRTVKPVPFDDDEANDIGQTWCSKGMAQIVSAIGMKEALALSMDQFEWLMKEGILEGENPAEEPEKLAETAEKMQEKWGDKLAALTNRQNDIAEIVE